MLRTWTKLERRPIPSLIQFYMKVKVNWAFYGLKALLKGGLERYVCDWLERLKEKRWQVGVPSLHLNCKPSAVITDHAIMKHKSCSSLTYRVGPYIKEHEKNGRRTTILTHNRVKWLFLNEHILIPPPRSPSGHNQSHLPNSGGT